MKTLDLRLENDGKLIQAETNIKSANMIAAMNFSFKINMCYLIQAKFLFLKLKFFQIKRRMLMITLQLAN